MSTKTERHSFELHPNLIRHMILSQTGSIQRALLEAVANSIDKDATQVDVTITDKSILIVDNGTGFQSKDEILTCFKTFGLPQSQTEAKVFGHFRMGRAQLFKWGRNVWSSGPFQMIVDCHTETQSHSDQAIEFSLNERVDGQNYTEANQGCVIHIELYETLSVSKQLELENELSRCLAWVTPVVTVNSKRINQDVYDHNWSVHEGSFVADLHVTSISAAELIDKITEGKAESKFVNRETTKRRRKTMGLCSRVWSDIIGPSNDYSRTTLDIYNVGVHVCSLPADRFQLTGTLVTTRSLLLNFARTEPDEQCPVWKQISSFLEGHKATLMNQIVERTKVLQMEYLSGHKRPKTRAPRAKPTTTEPKVKTATRTLKVSERGPYLRDLLAKGVSVESDLSLPLLRDETRDGWISVRQWMRCLCEEQKQPIMPPRPNSKIARRSLYSPDQRPTVRVILDSGYYGDCPLNRSQYTSPNLVNDPRHDRSWAEVVAEGRRLKLWSNVSSELLIQAGYRRREGESGWAQAVADLKSFFQLLTETFGWRAIPIVEVLDYEEAWQLLDDWVVTACEQDPWPAYEKDIVDVIRRTIHKHSTAWMTDFHVELARMCKTDSHLLLVMPEEEQSETQLTPLDLSDTNVEGTYWRRLSKIRAQIDQPLLLINRTMFSGHRFEGSVHECMSLTASLVDLLDAYYAGRGLQFFSAPTLSSDSDDWLAHLQSEYAKSGEKDPNSPAAQELRLFQQKLLDARQGRSLLRLFEMGHYLAEELLHVTEPTCKTLRQTAAHTVDLLNRYQAAGEQKQLLVDQLEAVHQKLTKLLQEVSLSDQSRQLTTPDGKTGSTVLLIDVETPDNQ